MEIAVSELVSLKQNQLTPDFILLALLSQPDSDAMKIIEQIAPDPVDTVTEIRGRIQQHYKNAAPTQETQVIGTQEVADLFRIAYEEAQHLGDEFISTGTLFLALFDPKIGHTTDILLQAGITRKHVYLAIKKAPQRPHHHQ